MRHSHNHAHAHPGPDAGDRRIAVAVLVNLVLTLVQIVGGVLSGSLALIADALHNFSDALALIIAFAARRIARREATARMNFGFGRAEIVAALINYTILIMIGLFLLYEAVMRFISPTGIDGWMVIWIAAIALVVDLVTAALTYTMSKSSMNIRAAFLHNVADVLGSVAVIVAGASVLLFGWNLADPIATLLIAGYILWHSLAEIGGVIRILMLGSPPQFNTEKVIATVRAIPGVDGVHRVRLWMVGEHDFALDAHLVIALGRWEEADALKTKVKAELHQRFGIENSTLELECSRHSCDHPVQYGT